MKLVHGKSRHPQSQGSVKHANGDIKDMLVAWMADNESQDWTTGIKFVQLQKKMYPPFSDHVCTVFSYLWQ